MSTFDPARPQSKSRLTLLAVLAAFVLPMVIAWLLTSGVLPWMPRARLNYGTLIEPPVNLKAFTFSPESNPFEHRFGEWTLATIVSTPCAQVCRANLDHIHRVHLALQEKMNRVHLVAIVDSDHSEFDARANGAAPRTMVLATDTSALLDSLRADPAVSKIPPARDQIFIVDYAGRAMMLYPVDADMAGVSRDIRRLLRASNTN